ncbi:MAG: GTPase HflX [Anaerolineae bacterium]|nr:GTPase HflX [Anaerolineae bacterium]
MGECVDPDNCQGGFGLHETTSTERAFLVGIELKGKSSLWHVQDSLDELAALADTAGAVVIGRDWQSLGRINPSTLIGSGKLDELVGRRKELGFNVLIFDDELSGRQLREIEEAFGDEDGFKVLDRTALILDIFARHAHTHEGALQVELAQLEYRMPRLTRAWTHLARQAGGRAGGMTGGVGVRGPGETQLEIDRRAIRNRISFLKKQIEEVRNQRRQRRLKRKREGIPVVALVGYTNAGKSTLLNALSDAGVLAVDRLFATLDPTTRRVELPNGNAALFTDTVGFIQKLPHQLVAAFRATLEEVQEADLLLHVIDMTHPNVNEQIIAVEDTLAEIEAADKPTIYAFNKIDQLDEQNPDEEERLADLLETYPDAIPLSALKHQGLDGLLDLVEEKLHAQTRYLAVTIPYSRGDLVNLFHQRGTIDSEKYTEQGTLIEGRLPAYLVAQFEKDPKGL